MQYFFIRTAAFIGALSVAAGAFAAHTLKAIFEPAVMQIFETAVRYQFYHVFALMATGILYRQFAGKLLKWAGFLFIAGIILFSGSLYGLCLIKHLNPEGSMWIGAVTPLGGICFIGGWLLLAAGIKKTVTL